MKKLKSALILALGAILLVPALGNPLQAAEGQIVIEDLTRSQLRVQIKRIEIEFYRVFNASLEDENLAIVCYEHVPTSSNIKQDVCEAQFLLDKRAQNVNDSRFGIDALLSPRSLQLDLAEEYEALTAAMTKLSQESEYFRELSGILSALRDELENK